MTEWGVVTVIVVLVGLLAAIIKPIVSLTKSITALDSSVGTLKESIDKNAKSNETDHTELWNKETEQDKQLGNHAERIAKVEESTKSAHHRIDELKGA